jgi:hypothetical protein
MVAAATEKERAMRRLVLFASGLVIACGGFAGSLGAQTAPANPRMPCHNAMEVAKQLSTKYDEAPVAFGLQSNGNLLQVYSSEEKGTWTVVSTTPAGMSCIVAAGKRWENLPAVHNDPMA